MIDELLEKERERDMVKRKAQAIKDHRKNLCLLSNSFQTPSTKPSQDGAGQQDNFEHPEGSILQTNAQKSLNGGKENKYLEPDKVQEAIEKHEKEGTPPRRTEFP